ncbi:MAG: hypothetical protein IJC84_04720 [Clostridia bacterium]|nr:hypothetical protein [Clostridia bacterium]
MKRLISLILSLPLLLAASCGKSLSDDFPKKEAGSEEGSVPTVTTKSIKTAVEDPLTWAKVEAIPKVSSEMTANEMRQMILDFAALELSFVWTPNSNWYLERYDHEYKVGSYYGGIPYAGDSGNVYKWLVYYDEETGVLDSKHIPGGGPQSIFFQCSSFAFSAWGRVSNSMTWEGTHNITEHTGIIKIGEYTTDSAIYDYHKQKRYTTEICENNGEQAMFRSYAKLLPADGVANYLPIGGHVLLIKEVQTVKNTTGIDGNESYVIFYEQSSARVWKTQKNGVKYLAQRGIDRKFTFKELFDKGYLPFGVKELYGLDPVEKAVAGMTLKKDTVSAEELCGASVTSNYAISTIHIDVTDKNGNTVYSNNSHVSGFPLLRTEYALSNRFYPSGIKKFEGQGCHVTVQIRVSTGHLLSAYEGNLI